MTEPIRSLPDPPPAAVSSPASLVQRTLTHGDMRQRARMVGVLDRLAEDQVHPHAREGHKDKGKLTVRQRIELLFDPDTFQETGGLRRRRASGLGMDGDRPYSDGVVTGWGQIHGRTVFCYALDARVFGGSLGEAQADKIHHCMDMAVAADAPIVAIHDGAGARVQEGGLALAGFGGIFQRHVAASGVVPQISVILGACAGGSAYAPALTDLVFMVRGVSQMVITGPDVVAAVTGERPGLEELGGADVHGSRSGVANFVYDDEQSCLEEVRWLLQLLPSSSHELPPDYDCDDPPDRGNEALLDLVPVEDHRAYDVREVIAHIVDDGEYLEVHEGFARNVVCALARIRGITVGLVANQPLVLAGAIDIDASSKAARFVGFCDAFHLPIVSLVDVPGFLPGVEQEHGGIIRHGAKLIFAYCRASVPRIQLILRKAYGGAYIVMDSPSVGADLSLAWPTHRIAVMGAAGAVDVIYRREITAAADPVARRTELIAQYEDGVLHPLWPPSWGWSIGSSTRPPPAGYWVRRWLP
ncbi:MAG: acyl-CoA carboxylase subunit beta [Tetrasphaera sp.]